MYVLIRTELIDFWRFLKQSSWNNKVQTHYMLYPTNPYPKQTRLQLRWYAHPSFPLCLQLLQPDEDCTIVDNPDKIKDRMMIVRSNWKQYLDEFAVSAKMILDSHQKQNHRNEDASGLASDLRDFAELVVGDVREMTIPVSKQDMEQQALTNFELKYWTVGEPTFELVIYSKNFRSTVDTNKI